MKSLIMYKGFKLEELKAYYPLDIQIVISIDGIKYNSGMHKICTCSEVINPKEHKRGCNHNWIPNGTPGMKIDLKDVGIIKVERLRKEHYYIIELQVGAVLWEALVSPICTCGMYRSDHPHKDCQYRLHPELKK